MCKWRTKHPSQMFTHLPSDQTTQMLVNMRRFSWLSSQVQCRIFRTSIRNIKTLTLPAAQNELPFTTKTKQLIFVKMMKSARADYHHLQMYLRTHIRYFKTLTPSINTAAQNGCLCHNWCKMVISVKIMKLARAGSYFNYLTAMQLAVFPRSSVTEMFYQPS
jgi:hypothetical protein